MQGHLQLRSEFWASLAYMRLSKRGAGNEKRGRKERNRRQR